ncbi:chromosome partitioning protein ParB, partial [Streptococcus pyogenes]
IKFLDIISPGRNPVDKFYLARELKLDGPIEEIERTLNKLKDNKETTTDHVLTTLAVEIAKPDNGDKDITRRMREIKKNILNNPEVNKHYI